MSGGQQGTQSGPHMAHCELAPMCQAEFRRAGKGSVFAARKTGWFIMKDGTAYCPAHIPLWVEGWRKRKANNPVSEEEREKIREKIGEQIAELQYLCRRIEDPVRRQEFRDDLGVILDALHQISNSAGIGGQS
jgi:hypothetical protein